MTDCRRCFGQWHPDLPEMPCSPKSRVEYQPKPAPCDHELSVLKSGIAMDGKTPIVLFSSLLGTQLVAEQSSMEAGICFKSMTAEFHSVNVMCACVCFCQGWRDKTVWLGIESAFWNTKVVILRYHQCVYFAPIDPQAQVQDNDVRNVMKLTRPVSELECPASPRTTRHSIKRRKVAVGSWVHHMTLNPGGKDPDAKVRPPTRCRISHPLLNVCEVYCTMQ